MTGRWRLFAWTAAWPSGSGLHALGAGTLGVPPLGRGPVHLAGSHPS